MKAYKFRIKNYLNIEELELDLSAGIQGFVGENSQGKTNIITAIHDFLTGESDIRKIMRGKERAELELVEYLDDKEEAKVTRIYTPNNKSNQFKGKGLKGKTPKSYITELFAAEAINPLYLISNDIVKYLKRHLPVKAKKTDVEIIRDYNINFDLTKNSFEECDRMIAYFKDVRERTYGVMRHKQEVVAELLENLPIKPLKDIVSSDEIQEKTDKVKAEIAIIDEHNKTRSIFQNRITANNILIEDLQSEVFKHANLIKDKNEVIEGLEAQEMQEIAKIKASFKLKRDSESEKILANKHKIEELKHKIDLNEEQIVKDKEQLNNYPIKDKDLLENKINVLRNEYIENERAKEIIKQYSQVERKKEEYEEIKKQYALEDEIYKHFAYVLPKLLISRANLPVEGVEFKDDELYVNNEHIDRLSSSNRHKVAAKLAAGLAKAKGHIALCLDGIEILDDKNRHEFMEEMQAYCNDLKFIFTRHGEPEYDFETKVVKGELVK